MTRLLDLHPDVARTIVEAKADLHGTKLVSPTKYLLFGMECPQDVMAAYERLWATRGRGGRAQEDGDLLVGWCVAASLTKGDFELASRLRIALETLGWQPNDGA